MAAKFVVEDGTGAPVITAGAFVVDITYKITTLDNTDFTAIGATANTLELEFTATGVGTGTGTATTVTPTNSYLSVADADQYHDNIGTATADWLSKTTAVKEQALRDATRYLDAHYGKRWKGFRTAKANPLDWPRKGVTDTSGYTVANDSLPVALEDATAEAALRSLDATQNPTGLTPDITKEGVVTQLREKGEGVGEEETHWDGGFSPYVTFSVVDQLLHDLIRSSAVVIR